MNIQAVPNYSKCKWTNGTLFITTMDTLYTHFYMIAPGIVQYTVLCSGFVCDLKKALLPLAYVEMLLNF